jgi:septum formation protein
MSPLVLASGSPVRRRLLACAGFNFEVVPAQVEEVLPPDASPAEVAAALALCKAHDVHARRPGAHVVGADQVLLLPQGALAGKTPDLPAARARLRELSGKTHKLVSAAAVVGPGVEELVAGEANVTFRSLSHDEMERCLTWGEWHGTAGSYLYEARGIHLVERVDGDAWVVLGLPLVPLCKLLRRLGAGPLTP